MQAKNAVVPFEDESFSWIAVSRKPAALAKLRIIAPPLVNKVAATFKTCGSDSAGETVIASRDKAAYKRAKKLRWGDSLDV